MERNSDSSTDSSRRSRRPGARSRRFAVAIVVVYAILLGGVCCGGMVGHVLYVGLLSSAFFAVYAAGPFAAAVWGAFMAHRLFVGRNKGALARTGVKSAVIVFGGIGLVLWTVATIPPSARTFAAGYWLHAKVWVDVDEIRDWASRRTPSADRFELIDADQWPASLRRAEVFGGAVTCDPEDSTVIFYEGGGYGHWGLTIGPPGAAPPDDDRHAIELQDGAWVWRD